MNGISLEKVSFRYSTSKVLQLKDVSFNIPVGSFYGITGLNGSGKTTISLMLNGLIPHEIQGKLDGTILIDNEDTKKHPLSYFAQKVGMLFQNPDFMLFNLTVYEEVAFGLKNFHLPVTDEAIGKSLASVGLAGFEQRDPQTLSLGEKQKVALACILALNTPYIILDEPVAMLDYRGAVNLYELLEKLNKQSGKTIIVVEHDTEFLLRHTQRTLVLHEGVPIFDDTTQNVFKNKKKLQEIGIKVPR